MVMNYSKKRIRRMRKQLHRRPILAPTPSIRETRPHIPRKDRRDVKWIGQTEEDRLERQRLLDWLSLEDRRRFAGFAPDTESYRKSNRYKRRPGFATPRPGALDTSVYAHFSVHAPKKMCKSCDGRGWVRE